MNEIINILGEQIKEYDIKIGEINKQLIDLRPMVKILKPNGNEYDKDNIYLLARNDELLSKERFILKSKKNEALWNEYMAANSRMDNDVATLFSGGKLKK